MSEDDYDDGNKIIEILDDDECLFVTDNEVAQAFSHFSYIAGGRKLLVCDLQGVSEGGRLQLTDPVIHSLSDSTTTGKYGRTDRGTNGIQDFLDTHQCNALCNMVA